MKKTWYRQQNGRLIEKEEFEKTLPKIEIHKKYRQDGSLIERIDFEKILPMSRYAGGHDEQMKGLLKNVTLIAHWNEGNYQGEVATCVMLNDTKEVIIYSDYYGSCSGCDAWDNASDDQVNNMCKSLAAGAYVFNNLKDCIRFLIKRQEAEESFNDHTRKGLLLEIINNLVI